jgi:hypothetical protein
MKCVGSVCALSAQSVLRQQVHPGDSEQIINTEEASILNSDSLTTKLGKVKEHLQSENHGGNYIYIYIYILC